MHIMCTSRESNQGPTGYYVYASPISYKTTSPNHRSELVNMPLTLPNGCPANISDSQTTITTTPDALTTDTKLYRTQRRRAKKQEQRKIARPQNSRLYTHDKDEMS